jgi:hypothetical protein
MGYLKFFSQNNPQEKGCYFKKLATNFLTSYFCTVENYFLWKTCEKYLIHSLHRD